MCITDRASGGTTGQKSLFYEIFCVVVCIDPSRHSIQSEIIGWSCICHSYVRADSVTRVEKVFEVAFKHFCVEPPCPPYDWCTHAEAPVGER